MQPNDSDIDDDYVAITGNHPSILLNNNKDDGYEHIPRDNCASQSTVLLQTPLEQLNTSSNDAQLIDPGNPIISTATPVNTSQILNAQIGGGGDWIDIAIVVMTKLLELYKAYHDTTKLRYTVYRQYKLLHLLPLLLLVMTCFTMPIVIDRTLWNTAYHQLPAMSKQLYNLQQENNVCCHPHLYTAVCDVCV